MLLCDKDGIFNKMAEHIIDKSHMNLNFAHHAQPVHEKNASDSKIIENQWHEEVNGQVNVAFDGSDM